VKRNFIEKQGKREGGQKETDTKENDKQVRGPLGEEGKKPTD